MYVYIYRNCSRYRYIYGVDLSFVDLLFLYILCAPAGRRNELYTVFCIHAFFYSTLSKYFALGKLRDIPLYRLHYIYVYRGREKKISNFIQTLAHYGMLYIIDLILYEAFTNEFITFVRVVSIHNLHHAYITTL